MARQDQSSSGPGGGVRSTFRQEAARARDAIRGAIIERWSLTHNDGLRPETSREVLGLWVAELFSAIIELPQKRIENLRGRAEGCAETVKNLDGVERDDIPIVEDSVRAAYWTYNSRASWSTAFDGFMEGRRTFFGVLTFLLIFFGVWVVDLAFVHEEDFKDFPRQGVVVLVALLIIALFIHGRILAIASLVNVRLLDVWRIVAATLAFCFVFQRGWRRYAIDWAMEYKGYLPAYFRVTSKYADVCILYALKGFGILVSIGVVIAVLGGLRYRVGPKEPDDAVASASILLDLLNLATLSQMVLEREVFQGEGLRGYLTSSARVEILIHLERVAQTAEGRWKKSLRVDDEVADKAVAEIGDGIAAAARKWKVVAATGGEKLADMSEAFTSALTDAAKGNWELLAEEAPEKEPLWRRVLRVVRHVLALVLMAGTACVVLLDPLSWLDRPLSPTVSSFVLMFAAIASISIDPTIVERLGNASKINGIFGNRK